MLESTVPVLASYRAKATDYSGRESRAFALTDRAARNNKVSSETKLMAALDDDKPTHSGGGTFRERMRNTNHGGTSFRLRHAKGPLRTTETTETSETSTSELSAVKLRSISPELDALREVDEDIDFEKPRSSVNDLVAALSSRISGQAPTPKAASATTTRISTGEIVPAAVAPAVAPAAIDSTMDSTLDSTMDSTMDWNERSSRNSVVRPLGMAPLDVARASSIMNPILAKGGLEKGSLSARLDASFKVDGSQRGTLLSARDRAASGAQTARTCAAMRRLQMRRGSMSARGPATTGATKLMQIMKKRRECDDERIALRDAPPASHRGGHDRHKDRSCTLSTAALMRTESAHDQQERLATERGRSSSPNTSAPATLSFKAVATAGSFSREMVRALIQKPDHAASSAAMSTAPSMTNAATNAAINHAPSSVVSSLKQTSAALQVKEPELSLEPPIVPDAPSSPAPPPPPVAAPSVAPSDESSPMVINLSDSSELRQAMKNVGASTVDPSGLEMLMPRASALPPPSANFRPSTCSRQYSASVRESIRGSKKGSQYGSMQGSRVSRVSHVSKPPSFHHSPHHSPHHKPLHDHEDSRHQRRKTHRKAEDRSAHHRAHDGPDLSRQKSRYDHHFDDHHFDDHHSKQTPKADKSTRLHLSPHPGLAHYESKARVEYGTTHRGHPGSSKNLLSHIEREPSRQRTRHNEDQDLLRSASSRHLKLRHETSEKSAKRLLTPQGSPVSDNTHVVLGKAVSKSAHKREERMHSSHSSATDLLAPPDDDVGRGSAKLHANYAFKVALYADEIEERVPAIVVWRFKKSIFLRLSNREPRFRADRGFYADMNTACTQVPRPYYGFNVVKLLEARIASHESVLPDDIATPRNARRYELIYRMHYEEAGRVRSMFELKVVVHATPDGGLLHLRLAQMRLKGQEHILGERNLETLALQSPTDQPTIMFTPQLFRNIHSVTISFFWVQRWQRRLNREVWTALGQLSDRDWTQFHRIRQHFVKEYRKNLEASHMAIEELDEYTEVDA